MTRTKIGKIAHDLLVKDFQTDDSQKPNVHEQSLEMQENFYTFIVASVNHGRGKMACKDYDELATKLAKNDNPELDFVATHNHEKCRPFVGDFYVEVYTFMAKLLPNVIRNRMYTRKSCPTPNYDQIVYRFNSEMERIEELWVLGTRATCFYFLQNQKEIRPDMYQTVDYIRQFADGSLFRMCKELNNEKEDTPELDMNTQFTTH